MIRVRLAGVKAGRDFDPDTASVKTLDTLKTLQSLQNDYKSGKSCDGFDESFLKSLSEIDFESVKVNFEQTESGHILLVLS